MSEIEEPLDVIQYRNNIFKKAMVLLLNRPSLEFIGILSYGVRINIESADTYNLRIKIPSLGYTDGQSITLMAWDEATPKLCSFIIAHEVWHMLFYHPARRGTRDPIMWNLAVDHVTNRDLRQYTQENILDWPEGCYFDEDINAKEPNITAEEYYNHLMENKDQFEIEVFELSGDGDGKPDSNDGDDDSDSGSGGSGGDESDNSSDDSTGDGDSQDGDSDSDSDGDGDSKSQPNNPQEGQSLNGRRYAKITNKKTGKVSIVPLDCETDTENQEKMEKACKKMSERGKMMWQSDTVSKGNMPGNIAQILDEVFKVEIPWEKVTETALLHYADCTTSRTWTVPDFYMRANYSPGRRFGEEAQWAIFVVDCSASVNDNDLKKFMGIICDSANYFDKVGILMHDHDLKQPEIYFDNRPDFDEIFDQVKNVLGRGGTSHADVFQRIDELHGEELLSVVCFLTDYESDVERLYKNHEWFAEVPSIWILNSTHPVVFDDTIEYDTIYIK